MYFAEKFAELMMNFLTVFYLASHKKTDNCIPTTLENATHCRISFHFIVINTSPVPPILRL